MRILHLSKYYHPYRGGIEKVIQELAESSVELGHQVTVICSSEDNQRHEETISGVHVIRWPRWFNLFSQPITPAVFRELKNYIDSYDVVQIHTPNPLMEFAVLNLKITKPMIVTYHCEVLRKTPFNRFYNLVSLEVLKKAQSIIVATPEHVKYSKNLSQFADKCVTIPFGLHERWSQKTLEINQRLKEIKDKHSRYFLFIGRMVPYKGVNILLEAMQKVDAHLLLVGKGPRLQEWNELKDKLNLNDRVTFLNQVENDLDFAAYIHGSEAVVLPSLTEAEAFGLVLLEGMACGKPLVTTNLNSGVRFVNQNGVTGISVEPNNSVALAEALNTIYSDDAKRKGMGENARRRFEENFTLEKFVSSYIQLYQELVSKQKAA